MATNQENLDYSWDFSEQGILRVFCATSGKNITNEVFLVRHWNQSVLTCYIAGADVEWPLMKVIITFTFCCDNLRKSKFMALKKPGKLREFFSPTLWPPCYNVLVSLLIIKKTSLMENCKFVISHIYLTSPLSGSFITIFDVLNGVAGEWVNCVMIVLSLFSSI